VGGDQARQNPSIAPHLGEAGRVNGRTEPTRPDVRTGNGRSRSHCGSWCESESLRSGTCAECQPHPVKQVQSPDDQARSYEILFLAVVRAVLKEGGIEFDFRPEFAKSEILECVIPQIISSQEICVGSWKADSKCSLCIKGSEALAVSYSGRNYGVLGTILVFARRYAPTEKSSEDIVAVLFVLRQQGRSAGRMVSLSSSWSFLGRHDLEGADRGKAARCGD
jgi:hypothetical protein